MPGTSTVESLKAKLKKLLGRKKNSKNVTDVAMGPGPLASSTAIGTATTTGAATNIQPLNMALLSEATPDAAEVSGPSSAAAAVVSKPATAEHKPTDF